MDIKFLEFWDNDFVPTMLGSPWKGTGAYNSNYQTCKDGPLMNDTEEVSRKSAGPNIYVTRRWRKKLKVNEIKLIEILLAEEIEKFNYEFLFLRDKGIRNLKNLKIIIWKPLSGELPNFQWLLKSLKYERIEKINRLFYFLVFPIFFVLSRLIMLSIIQSSDIFNLKENDA